VFLVETRRNGQILCGCFQLLARLGVILDHVLGKPAEAIILCLAQRELARLNFEHVAVRCLIDELGRVHVGRRRYAGWGTGGGRLGDGGSCHQSARDQACGHVGF
jgi:hypothetical protein